MRGRSTPRLENCKTGRPSLVSRFGGLWSMKKSMLKKAMKSIVSILHCSLTCRYAILPFFQRTTFERFLRRNGGYDSLSVLLCQPPTFGAFHYGLPSPSVLDSFSS